MMFDNVLNRKQGFLAYKNVTTIICIMEKLTFFQRSKPRILVKKLKFLPSSFSFSAEFFSFLMVF